MDREKEARQGLQPPPEVAEAATDTPKPSGAKRRGGRRKKADPKPIDSGRSTYRERKAEPHGTTPVTMEEGSKRYWLGTFEDSPWQNITLGGACFPLFTDVPVPNDAGMGRDEYRRMVGAFLYLSDEDVDRIRLAASRKVIRIGNSGRATMLNSQSNRYRRHGGDKPAGHFVFLIEFEEASKRLGPGFLFEGASPPPLIDAEDWEPLARASVAA